MNNELNVVPTTQPPDQPTTEDIARSIENKEIYEAASTLLDMRKESPTQQTLPIPLGATAYNTPKPRTRQKALTPAIPARKDTISMVSHSVNRAIIDGLRSAENYKQYPDEVIAEYKASFGKEKSQLLISIQPEEGEGWDQVLYALNTLGDGCIDTYIALLAIMIEQNGVERIDTPVMVKTDDILEARRMKKSNGGYTTEQRAEVIKHLKTLSQAYITATIPNPEYNPQPRRGRKAKGDTSNHTVLKAEGVLVDLLKTKLGTYQTITGEELWERRGISIGPWLRLIPGVSNNIAVMLRQVLAYSAKNQVYQKRLGIYLTMMFRINARRGDSPRGTFPEDITMRGLLDGAGITMDKKHPQRSKDAILKALDDLKKSNVIGDYWQIVDASETGKGIAESIQQQAYGWGELWLDQKLNFSPPNWLKEQYKNILEAAHKAKPGRGKLV